MSSELDLDLVGVAWGGGQGGQKMFLVTYTVHVGFAFLVGVHHSVMTFEHSGS